MSIFKLEENSEKKYMYSKKLERFLDYFTKKLSKLFYRVCKIIEEPSIFLNPYKFYYNFFLLFTIFWHYHEKHYIGNKQFPVSQDNVLSIFRVVVFFQIFIPLGYS